MQVIVDRIENDYLVVELEDGNVIDMPKELCPKAKEGDVIDIFINEEDTKNRKEEVKNLMEEVFLD